MFAVSATTIGGLTPLLFETSLQTQFLIPMALTIVFGLMVTTVLVLVVVPALVAVQDDLPAARPPPHIRRGAGDEPVKRLVLPGVNFGSAVSSPVRGARLLPRGPAEGPSAGGARHTSFAAGMTAPCRPPAWRPSHPAQQGSLLTSFSKLRAASLRPSTVVR